MKSRRSIVVGIALLALLALGSLWLLPRKGHSKKEADRAYADPASCARCHAGEAAGYARTGMAHAFYRPAAADTVEIHLKEREFYHAASGTYYELTQRDGKYFQHRWQKGFDGKPENVEELTIDYVMGSGNHVRTYLHREQDGTLIELPLAWYAEDGGHLGMNPGFDNAHPMTRRPIAYECMFCHNAYPQIPPVAHRDLSASPVYEGALPEGIDCQRCHGPGAAHVRIAESPGASLSQIRAQILNPTRLSNDRQMEVCEQCHLETTSRPLPDRIRHYDQEPFGYDPGQPLSSFNSYFNKDPAKGRTDNFEIVSAPYRLRQSQCYLKSEGALTCEMCHDPHDLHKGAQAATYYANICMKCHAANLPEKIAAHQHTASNDCVSCHMPKRRTEDVVHAIMTDHLIQRQPPPAKVLLAERTELQEAPIDAYRGRVNRYPLDNERRGPNDNLYNAVAQVIDDSNSDEGIAALSELLRTKHPSQPNFYIELGDARRHTGDLQGGIDAYRQALNLDPLSSRAQRRLGVSLGGSGHTADALSVLHTAIEHEPGNALLWYEQALIESRSGDSSQAVADLRKALQVKPDFADAQNTLGSILAQSSDARDAEAAFREALAINPYDAGTRANLGRLLASRQDWSQAGFQLQKAVQLDPSNSIVRGDLAVVLLQMDRIPDAEAEARAAVRTDTRSARLHDCLGQILLAGQKSSEARKEFEAALALDANFGPAQLDLAEALLQQGQVEQATRLLQIADHSSVPGIAGRARDLLQQLRPR